MLIFFNIAFSSAEISFGITFLVGGLFVLPFGKSRIWPTLDLTIYSEPKYLDIVLAFAGDSTITRDLAIINFFSFFINNISMLHLASYIYNIFKLLFILSNSSMPKFSSQRNTITAFENIISIIDSGNFLSFSRVTS